MYSDQSVDEEARATARLRQRRLDEGQRLHATRALRHVYEATKTDVVREGNP